MFISFPAIADEHQRVAQNNSKKGSVLGALPFLFADSKKNGYNRKHETFQVKHTPPDELTRTGQPLGWLLTVLQKERASVEEITQTLETALQHLGTLQVSHTQYHQAILYFASLIYHRRSPAERQPLIQVVDAYAPTMEVETMLQSMAEITYQQGARRASIESTLAILNRRFPEADLQTLPLALEAIDDINRLKQLNIEASVVDTFHVFQEQLQA